MPDKTALGDRMKLYEGLEAGRVLLPYLPVLARLDGMCFSKFTKPLRRPYDIDLSSAMRETTQFLVKETNALVGYTQSDEISLLWEIKDHKSEFIFGGRVQKLVSYLSSLCTLNFNAYAKKFLGSEFMNGKSPLFDCRVWNVPSREEAANTFVWRELDATKNSISMAAQHYFSHKELQNKNSSEMQEMLFLKGVNWNDYPDFFKRGSYFQRKMVARKFTCEEIEKLPKLHEARRNPDLLIQRHDVIGIKLPPILKVGNRINVLFYGDDPISTNQEAENE
jgi:tRNA(His) 5'-end guanylyltransferase